MQKVIGIVLFMFVNLALAQPTFTASDLNPSMGDIFTRFNIDTTGINEGSSGANQNWNFNLILNSLNKDSQYFVAPNLVPLSGLFPTANVVGQSTVSPNIDYEYYNASNASLELVGQSTVDNAGNIDTTIYLTPLSQYKYPITYQSAFYDTTSTLPISSGLFTTKTKYNRAFIADAYGDLTINNQLFSNVMRFNYKDTITVDIAIFQLTFYIESFFWCKPSYKQPILIISKSVDPNGINGKSIGLNGDIPSSILGRLKDNQVSVYPNPAINVLRISNGFKTKTSYAIKDVNGKTILNDELDQLANAIDITSIENGIYILELKSKDRTLITKFVKQK
jgi:hypothetical protein